MKAAKFYIESSLFPKTEVEPVFDGLFEFVKDGKAAYYRFKMKSNLKFGVKVDYTLIKQLESVECEEAAFTIERLCGGVFSEYWKGFIQAFDFSTVDEDFCYIEVKPEVDDGYKCFLDYIKEKVGIFSAAPVVSSVAIGGTYEEQTCYRTQAAADCVTFTTWYNTPYSACLAVAADWCLVENRVYLDGVLANLPDCVTPPYDLTQETDWHREVIDWPCNGGVGGTPVAPSYGSGWTLIQDDCATLGTAKWWRCPASTSILSDHSNGRLLNDVLEFMVAGSSCPLTVKSDFFNINPLGDAPSNIAYTYALANLHYLTIHQKSDVKRPSATNQAGTAAWVVKPKDLFDDLEKIFNIRYIIEDGVLILEHVSFFTSGLGLDLTGEPIKRKYGYTGGENIKEENFYWSDRKASAAFLAEPITYDCGENEKEQPCNLISTDLRFIENPINEDKIDDAGFVLIANYEVNGSYVTINENEPLQWSMLHENLHKHARLFKSGLLNNVQQNFLSWIPYKKQEPFKTSLCCSDSFNPSDLVQTSLGNGTVSTATLNIFTGRIELELLY